MEAESSQSADPPSTAKPRRKRRSFQFSLRSLLIFTVVVAIGAAWLGRRIEQKHKEQAAIDEIVKAGGKIVYDLQQGTHKRDASGPKWLRKLLGDNFFSEVTGVDLANGTDAQLAYLDDFPQLKTLVVSGTGLSDAGIKHLNELSQLQELLLLDLNITNAALLKLRGMPNLNNLQFRKVNITDTGLADLKELGKLTILGLRETKITDGGLPDVKRLSRLEWLSLDKCAISDTGLANLQGLAQLRDLYLCDTQVTDAGLVNLKDLTRLRLLELIGTKVTQEGAANLQKALPQCMIVFGPWSSPIRLSPAQSR